MCDIYICDTYFNRTSRFSCPISFFEDSILSEFTKFITLKCVRFQFCRGALCGAKVRHSFVSMSLFPGGGVNPMLGTQQVF